MFWNQASISPQVVNTLGDRIHHVHVHDDVRRLGDELKTVGHDGYVSLEIIQGQDLPRDLLTETGERLQGFLDHVKKRSRPVHGYLREN